MRLLLGSVLFGIAACGDPAAPVEPDARPDFVPPTAARPGPCASFSPGEFQRACTMTYDSGDRLAQMECQYVAELGAGASCPMTDQWILTYRTDGGLARISRQTQECDSALFVYDALDFGEPRTGTERRARAVYRAETTATYEAELVVVRHPFEDQIPLLLGARDALVSTHHEYEMGGPAPIITDHTFTYDGPHHQGVRVQTRDDGVQMTFEYDAQGRLIAASGDAETPARSYAYDGELLVRDGAVVYQHDEFGNLVGRIDEDTSVTTRYDYGCWE